MKLQNLMKTTTPKHYFFNQKPKQLYKCIYTEGYSKSTELKDAVIILQILVVNIRFSRGGPTFSRGVQLLIPYRNPYNL